MNTVSKTVCARFQIILVMGTGGTGKREEGHETAHLPTWPIQDVSPCWRLSCAFYPLLQTPHVSILKFHNAQALALSPLLQS